MSAHVSVFDLKRFAQARLAADELPSFEQHLTACASCAGRLQWAATRELHARGLDGFLTEAGPKPVAAMLIALAASVLFALSLGHGPMRLSPQGMHGALPSLTATADGGDGSLAFFDGGGVSDVQHESLDRSGP